MQWRMIRVKCSVLRGLISLAIASKGPCTWGKVIDPGPEGGLYGIPQFIRKIAQPPFSY